MERLRCGRFEYPRPSSGRRGRGCFEKNRPHEPADHALGRSRGGFGTKLHLVTDRAGTPLGALVTAGQTHESTCFEAALDSVRLRGVGGRRRPDAIAGDKGYSYPRIRAWCSRRGIEAVIPTRRDQRRERFSKSKYRGRNVVERCIGWLKECRRVATRYEKLATHFLAVVALAMIQRCLRLLDPSNRA
ncbi:MAG: IS5 family transposase [Phycisphaerae bacterium]|nr:IS5 family transposase [Phycisphaerae bacterium]